MIAGHLQEKGGKYYAVLNCKHHNGKRFPKWIPTELTVKKGNKRAAEKMLENFRATYNSFGEVAGETETKFVGEMETDLPQKTVSRIDLKHPNNILFADYMLYWLSYKEIEVDPVTYAGYCYSVEESIYPYFKELGVTLSELQPSHLKAFYLAERKGDQEAGKKAKKGTTVARYHANIHAALETAMEDGLIGKNVAHKQRPATEKFIGQFYLPEEALECIKHAEGTPLELAILFGLFYGLRRSEIVGLKWQNFDLNRNTFTIAHTVTAYSRKGQKTTIYAKDKTKNKSSMRTLPLIPMFQTKLKALLAQQQEDRRVFGNSYNPNYIGYLYVNEIGDLLKPDYITNAFPVFLKKHNMRRIRFHDTRHAYVKL
ncbi:site-specific integrase [Anaerotignum sp.]|uniref:site-specific integrase n=1 Tax=Anaerotignum sp. TaxID=2039241 RepID=UPI0028AA960E|nr:tyrosine-type recombinase/integrase [Anaerotignum sp.]